MKTPVKKTETPTPQPATPPAGGFEMSLILKIGNEEFILNGQSYSNGINVNYSKPWKEAADLGPVADAIDAIGGVLGLTDLKTKINEFVEKGLPGPLQSVATAFFTAHIIITDLVIDTRGIDGTDKYAFGLGLLFTGATQPKVGTVTLEAFLLKYTYSKAHA
jgi:hypothetical protein